MKYVLLLQKGLPASTWLNRLRDFMNSIQAIDLGSSCLPFIWNNKRKGRYNIKQMINRVLVSAYWFYLFSKYFSKESTN